MDEFDDCRCLLLEGEAGLGKSTALKEAAAAHELAGARVRLINLAEHSNDAVFRAMFEHEEGSGPFYVFVDSLDECTVPNASLTLARELRTRAPGEVRFRIACRTGVWPEALRTVLHTQWPDAVALDLAPLHAKDIRHAAELHGLDAVAFMRAVDELEAEPLAMKPVTLELLLEHFKANHRLPESQADLYRVGCLTLCRESSANRVAVRDLGRLGEHERLAIAERVAALSVVAGRGLIAHTPSGGIPTNVLSVADFSGGTEPLDGGKVETTEAAIREVLEHTGLFTRAGERYLAFSHRTFAEFLAAEYCRTRLSWQQVKSLLVHPDGSGRIVPQLTGVAAWLATMQDELFEHVLANDPSILIGGDARALPAPTRSRIMAAVLHLHARGRPSESWDNFARFQKLKHDGIASQLRDVFLNGAMPQNTRRFALSLARLFSLTELAPALVRVAVNRDEPSSLREHALAAMSSVPPELARDVAAILDDLHEDPRHELRGQVLRLVWPDALDGDAFRCLRVGMRSRMGGAYDGFLLVAAQRLRDEHLVQGIAWVENLPRDIPFAVRGFATQLIQRAAQQLFDPTVLNRLAECIWKRASAHEPLVGDYYDKEMPFDEQVRRRILLELLDAFVTSEKDATALAFSRPPMLRSRDLPWLVETIECESVPLRRERLAECVPALALIAQDADSISMIVGAAERLPEIRARLPDWLGPVPLDSERARLLKREHEQRLSLAQDDQAVSVLLEPPPAERVERSLAAAESGDADQWCNVVAGLSLEETSTNYGDWSEDDLQKLPGWAAATEGTRARILESARRYLLLGDALNDEWLGSDHLKTAAVDGYKALRLLFDCDRPWVEALGASAWAKWAPIVVAFPEFQVWPARQQLRRMAEHHAPAETARALACIARQNDRRHGRISDLDASSDTWGPDMVREVMGLINDPTLKPASTADALQAALAHGVGEAFDVAVRLVGQRNKQEPPTAKELGAAVALALLLEQTRAFWPTFSELLRDEPAFCRELLLALVQRIDYRHSDSIAGRLDSDQLAELYVWLSKEFPRSEDPIHHGPHPVGPRESVADFRDGLVGALRRLSDPTALAAIRRVRAALPEHEDLNYAELELEQAILERNWLPPSPRALLELARSSELRLVESPLQLIELVTESLDRLDDRLQGTLPEARFLWHQCSDGLRPRDEGDFADYVAARLKDDLSRRGIIFNREVQIRRNAGPGTPGELTDIHVTAVPKAGSPTASSITVIIEAKGSWNSQLDSAMEEQLRDRYLKKNQTKHGIYLVGRFASPQWSPGDARRRVNVKDVVAMRAHFAAQAAQFSTDGIILRAAVLDVAYR